jgi:hypothetical protein
MPGILIAIYEGRIALSRSRPGKKLFISENYLSGESKSIYAFTEFEICLLKILLILSSQ